MSGYSWAKARRAATVTASRFGVREPEDERARRTSWRSAAFCSAVRSVLVTLEEDILEDILEGEYSHCCNVGKRVLNVGFVERMRMELMHDKRHLSVN